MDRLLLETQHRALQATCSPIAGREVPIHYGNPVAEHEAVRKSAGVADLSARALWSVTGPDRAKYLQGTLTNDLAALGPGQSCYTALLDVKGHLQADLYAYAMEEAILLDLDQALEEPTIATLKKYVVIYKVTLNNVSEDWLHLFVSGPNTVDWLSGLFGSSLPTLQEQQLAPCQWQGQSVWLIRRSETGEFGLHLLVPVSIGPAFWSALLDAGKAVGGRPIGQEALESLRIEAGIPRFGVDMDSTRFPAEAGLEHAISYTKGCYLGQETTMRLKTQGAVNRKLVGLLIDGPTLPQHGTPLLADGQTVGSITSVLDSPTLMQKIAMGYLRKGFFDPGSVVALPDRNTVRVTALPFYKPATLKADL